MQQTNEQSLKQASDFQLKEHYSLEELQEILRFLRSPQGCPWDREQTHDSLRSALVEEAYETVSAIEARDMANLKEELGDVLLQVLFHSDLAREEGQFDFEDVVSALAYKLISRHSHVFGESPKAVSGKEALSIWEANKKKEKQARTSADYVLRSMKDIPASSSLLFQARKLQNKAAKLGFAYTSEEAAKTKLLEEWKEWEAASSPEERQEEIGDFLFMTVHLARLQSVDPVLALRAANEKYLRRFEAMFALCEDRNLDFERLSPEEKIALWQEVKKGERKHSDEN